MTLQPAEDETDILVIGSGAAGLTAAIVGADLSARVVVVEKSELFGGTSATSGGVLWMPASHLALAQGQADTLDEGEAYIASLAGEGIAREQIRAFVENAPEMLQYLEREADIAYQSIPYTDYHAEMPGGKLGYRSHDVLPLDGRVLGADLDRLRPTHPAAMLFGKISWTAADVAPMVTRQKGWLRSLARVLWRYYSDVGQRLRSPRARFLTGGNALLGRLKLACDQRGIPLWLNTQLRELFVEDGKVVGAVLLRDGREVRLRASRGVILAAGGFEWNGAMRQAHLGVGSTNPTWSGSQPSNTGDAILAAQQVGAAVKRMAAAWWAPTVKVPGEDRARPLFIERALPGSMMVDRSANRFTNEAASYHIVGRSMAACNRHVGDEPPFYILFDAAFRARYPLGPLMPGIPDALTPSRVRSMVVKAGTWEEIARRTGLPVEELTATVKRFNEYAKTGKDLDFGRGDSPYDRYFGDARAGANPNLAPLVKPPFYAVPVYPGDIGTSGGLATDSSGAVLDGAGSPIAGLYAIGNTAASVMGVAYPGAGSTLAPGMTFGYLAARQMMSAPRSTTEAPARAHG